MGAGANRNTRCPCGSGQKVKNCQQCRVPVEVTCTVEFEEPVRVIGTRFEPDGTITFLTPDGPRRPKHAVLETTKKRANAAKPTKVLSKAPLPVDRLVVSLNDHLRGFDLVLAADTNSTPAGTPPVSVLCVTGLDWNREKPDVARITVNGLIEFHGVTQGQERIGWAMALHDLVRWSGYDRTKRTALIVDSELGLLEKINRLEEPVVERFFLPEGVELVYASDQPRNASIASQMIRACHTLADRVLQDALVAGSTENLRKVEGMPFSHLRNWVAEPKG